MAWLTITAVGVGYVDVPLEFLVIDESTGFPLESASIWIHDHLGPKFQGSLIGATGRDGRAKVILDTYFSEGCNSLFRVYRHVNYLADLRVSAENYQAERFDLRDFTEGPRYHYDEVPPPIVIRLRKRQDSVTDVS
jgi:hypothetical protein